MKLIAFLLFLGSMRPAPELPDPPITNQQELIERIEQKFIGNDKMIAMGAGGPYRKAVVDWVTPEYRPVVIDYLKSKAKDSKYLERAQRALIALDDEETILDAIKQFNDGTLKPAGILWQNLKVSHLKYVIPIIFEGSETPQPADLGKPKSPRYYAVDISLSLISSSAVFPDSTARWASGLRGHSYNNGPDPHIMWLFQQWWEHNKDAVIAGKYSEATWLPMYKGKPDVFGDDDRSEPTYLNYTAAMRNDILPIPKHASIGPEIKAATPTQQAVSPVAPTQNDGPMFVFIGVGLLAILAAVWVWFKRVKR